MGGIDHQRISEAAPEMEQLTRSDYRIHILNELFQHKELHRDELKESIDASRTTLQRNLETLAAQGWIENSGATFRITPCGELIAKAVLDFVETTIVAKRLQTVFQWIPVSEIDFDLHQFADAEVLTPEAGDPYAMINRHVRLLRNGNRIRGMLKVTCLHAAEASHEAIVDHGGTGELVTTSDVADTLTENPVYAGLTEEMLETERFDLFVYEGDIPYSLVLIDDIVQLAADENEDPKALIQSTSGDVREWAEETYAEYKEQATRIV